MCVQVNIRFSGLKAFHRILYVIRTCINIKNNVNAEIRTALDTRTMNEHTRVTNC